MNHRNTLWSTFLLFLLGIGSETKTYFYGCLAFSEMVVFIMAPIILLRHYRQMRFQGLIQPVVMIMGLMAAMFASSLINHSALPFIVKSFALMYGVLSYYIVFTHLLKSNPKGLGWFFVGAAISSAITIFAFNPQAVVSENGSCFIEDASVESVINGQLFWTQRILAFGQIPIVGWYLTTPFAYSLFAPVVFTVFIMLTTISGRSASLSVLFAGALIFLGRKSRRTMGSVGRRFYPIVIAGIVLLLSYKAVYRYVAINGMLGQDAQVKYENQTKLGNSMLQLLMSGRKEFFMGLTAAIDRPIVGFGPHAEDKQGYAMRFLSKYGDSDDIDQCRYYMEYALMYGYKMEIRTHSHIIGAWVHYGIFGLFFYLWLLYVMYRHLRKYMAAIPQWYGYFALNIGAYLWHIFFSPVGSRYLLGLFFATLFVAKSIGDGKVPLPFELDLQARKYD